MARAEIESWESQPHFECVRLGDLSFGIYLPSEVITNEEVEQWNITTTKDKLLTASDIHEKIGINRRFRADARESAIDMGIQAALATRNSKDVDAIFTATSYPVGKNVSQEIGNRLGIRAKSHLDVYAACSSFVLGITYMKEHEEEFNHKKVLFVATEKYSHTLTDLREGGIDIDPSMAQLIFSDGAVACVFEFGKDLRVLAYENRKIKLPKKFDNCIRMPIDRDSMTMPFIEEPVPNSESGKFEQDGLSVIRGVISNVPDLNKRVVKNARLQASDIQLVIPHQSSGPVLAGLSNKMPGYTVFKDIQDGNFSSASIPKAMTRAIKEGEIQRGDKILLSGFGAGLYASTAIVELGQRFIDLYG